MRRRCGWDWRGVSLEGPRRGRGGCSRARDGGAAAAAESIARDTLVYKNGDRLCGQLVTREGQVIVLKSDWFGELRVPVLKVGGQEVDGDVEHVGAAGGAEK